MSINYIMYPSSTHSLECYFLGAEGYGKRDTRNFVELNNKHVKILDLKY